MQPFHFRNLIDVKQVFGRGLRAMVAAGLNPWQTRDGSQVFAKQGGSCQAGATAPMPQADKESPQYHTKSGTHGGCGNARTCGRWSERESRQREAEAAVGRRIGKELELFFAGDGSRRGRKKRHSDSRPWRKVSKRCDRSSGDGASHCAKSAVTAHSATWRRLACPPSGSCSF